MIFLLQFTNILANIIQLIYFYVKFMILAFDRPPSYSPCFEMIIIFLYKEKPICTYFDQQLFKLYTTRNNNETCINIQTSSNFLLRD